MAMTEFRRVTPRFPVANLAATIDFYTKKLGFRPEALWPKDNPTFCILDRDSVSLAFYEADSRSDPASPGGGEIYIDVDDVTGLHRSLKDLAAIEWGPEVYGYGRREFALLDPDGYRVIFTEPTDDPPTCDEP